MSGLDILQNYAEATVTTSLNATDAALTSDNVTISALSGTWAGLGTNQQMRVMDRADVLAGGTGYEVMLLTANNGGVAGTWTLLRGVGGSTIKAHAANWTLVPAVTSNGVSNTAVWDWQMAAERSTTSLGESLPRKNCETNVTGFVSQQMSMMAVEIAAEQPVGHLCFASGGTALGTPVNWWAMLMDSNLNMLAVTADQLTTALGGSSTVSLAIANIASGPASTFWTNYSGLHYIGWMFNATTMPTAAGMSTASSNFIVNISGMLPRLILKSSITTYTTPPAFPHQPSFSGGAVPGFWTEART